MDPMYFYSFILALVASVKCNEFYAVSKISADLEYILRNISDVTMTSCQMECMRDSKCKTIGLTTSKTKENDGSLYICHLLKEIDSQKGLSNITTSMLHLQDANPAPSKWKRITFAPKCNKEEIEIKVDQTLAILEKITSQFIIHVEMNATYIPYGETEFLTSFHFTNSSKKGGFGDSIAKLLTYKGKLEIAVTPNDKPMTYVKLGPLVTNKWQTFEISQIKKGTDFYHTVTFDGKVVSSEVNNHPTGFNNVKVHLSNSWDPHQPGFVRNFWIDIENN